MSESVCPESSIESANRRNFVKKAALAAASVGIGGSVLSKSTSILAESRADSAFTTVTTDTPSCNTAGSVAVFDGSSDITSAFRSQTAYLCGAVYVCCGTCCIPSSLLSVNNRATYCPNSCLYPGVGLFGASVWPAGVSGSSCVGSGVCGSSLTGAGVTGTSYSGGPGVSGESICGGPGVSGYSGTGPGVLAQSNTGVALCVASCNPITGSFENSAGSKDKTAGIQIKNGCSISWNAGVGGVGDSHGLTDGQLFFGHCGPKMILNTCGKVGIGTIAPNATLQINGGVSVGTKIKTGPYTMTSSDFAVLVNAGVKAITIKLPSASTTGQLVHVKKIDASANKVTVERQGTDTIESSTSKTLAAEYDSLTLIAGGNGIWYILSNAT